VNDKPLPPPRGVITREPHLQHNFDQNAVKPVPTWECVKCRKRFTANHGLVCECGGMVFKLAPQ